MDAYESVTYELHLPLCELACDGEDRTLALEAWRVRLLEQVAEWTSDYVWHRQPFTLHVHTTKEDPRLWGRVWYGDNVDDEWFVVFLLRALTQVNPTLVASVWDGDGQFLLIEAADVIPRWLKPETSDGRVFLHRGVVHIVPIPQTPADLCTIPATPALSQAIALVRSPHVDTRASSDVQEVIARRLEGFPLNSPASARHYARCIVPIHVAECLHRDPQLIARAVETFYLRDPLLLRVCNRMETFSPRLMVPYRVRFSRCLYAMLTQQVFHAPKTFRLPPVSHRDHKAAELGMKVACGFEMMFHQARHRSWGEGSVAQDDVTRHSKWAHFKDALERMGFFKNLPPECNENKARLQVAMKYFGELISRNKEEREDVDPLHMIREVLGESLQPSCFPEVVEPDDNEDWLHLSDTTIDRILTAHHSATGTNADLEDVVDGVHRFVGKVSSHEGAEVPSDVGNVTFDAEKFLQLLQKGTSAPAEDILSSSEGSEAEFSGGEGGEETSEAIGAMEEIMCQMDAELSHTNIGKSFQRQAAKETEKDGEKGEMEEFQPVAVDRNLLENFLTSFSAEHGIPGPVSSLLGSMGMELPEDKTNKP